MKKEKEKKKVEEPAFEFVPGGRGAQNVAASRLGPRLGEQSSPAARRAACARAASPDAEVSPQVELGGSGTRPGPRGGHASHRRQGPYSITALAAEAAATARTTAPGSASSI